MLKIFIGYDPRQPVAFQVLASSIWRHSSKPVSISRLDLRQLPIKRRGLTEFTYTRFLVPWLCRYEGQALFIDSDFLCLGDVAELFSQDALCSDVWVVKNPQLKFEWASMMMFNSHRCARLTPEYVDDVAHPLFDFAWADKVGELPTEWNHCVGYDQPNPNAKMVHYTQGIPIWKETADCEFSKEWNYEALLCNATVSFEALMGNSVHAKHVYAKRKLRNMELPPTEYEARQQAEKVV